MDFSRRAAERQSSQSFFNFWSILSLIQTSPKLLYVKINLPPILSALFAPLREILMGTTDLTFKLPKCPLPVIDHMKSKREVGYNMRDDGGT